MKRVLIVILLMVICQFSLVAQSITRAEVVKLYNEGAKYLSSQKYAEALECMEKARDGFHVLEISKYEIDALIQIGTIKDYQADFKGALAAYIQAKDLAKSIKYDDKLMSILRDLFKLYDQAGESEQRMRVMTEMDSLATYTEDYVVKYDYYNQMGDEARNQGNYHLAERWYKRNETFVMHSGKETAGVDKYLLYLKLKDLYVKADRLDDALTYALLSKNELHSLIDNTDHLFYDPYRDIAAIYKYRNDSINCFLNIDTLFLSLSILEEPREIAPLYSYRALCYSGFKDFNRALGDYKKADEVLATRYDELDMDRVKLLPLMAAMEYQLGHIDESEQLYKKNAESIRALYGEKSSEYIDALSYLANIEGFAGHLGSACNDYISVIEILKNQIRERLPYSTIADRDGYWNKVYPFFQDMPPFALEAKEFQTPFTQSCYDGVVLQKGFLLESDRTVYDIVKSNGTAADMIDYNAIAAMKAEIRELEKNGDQNVNDILDFTLKVNQLESRLIERCSGLGDLTGFMNIDYNQIKTHLNKDDVLIDFTDFISASRGRIYAAFIIDTEQKYPLLKELCAERSIDSMQVLHPDMYYESPYAEKMYDLLWKPFKGHVKEGATVYYVPTQLLFRIALESLPAGDGKLLGKHYRFVRLSSARELVKHDDKINIDLVSDHKDAVLYGGLKYDLEAKDMAEEARKYDVSTLVAVRGGVIRVDSVYRELPGTQKEVDAIERILKSHNLTVTPFTGKIGTEESFLNMNGKAPKILHIATHGFYYTPDEAQQINYLKGFSDAMSLSGLVMSGGNAAWRGQELPEGVLSGILTASNISRLDLSNIKLAVLSACQSGNGEATSEGLYGLQRAFKKAGVETMIMSLWNVDDAVSSEFMTLFYTYLLDKDNNMDKRAAFDKAKKTIREKYPEPFYWAGYVMLD